MLNAQKKTTSALAKFAFAATFMLFAATSSFAELKDMGDATPANETSRSGIRALIGIGGGNSMSTVSSIMSDVENHKVKHNQLVNYKAFGGFVELFPLRFDKFSVSVPIQAGGGSVSALEPGDEAYETEDYFFIADMAVHFNYRITKMLEISIGGGYRMFTGIEENNLENLDFCTPFGELRFTVRE